MSDRDDSSASRRLPGRGVALPLPPPEEDVGTRVRMSDHLPDTTARDMPFLPGPEPTTPFERLTLAELLADEEPLDDERTMVDPPALPQRSPATYDPGDDDASWAAAAVAPPRLPLPAPPEAAVARATLPGTRRRQEAEPPRPRGQRPPPPPARDRRAGERADHERERSTTVESDPLAPLAAPLVGDRYRIVQRIGEGGMGRVYKVTHAQLGKTFALKIITNNLAGEEGKARELFYREARMASSLAHPNIASVVDFGEDAQLGAFMVMEFVEGEPLSKLLHREGRLGVRQACELVLQVAEALHYIHTNKIVHCDIKTENILLCELPGTNRRKQLQVKLLDFGLAKSTNAARITGSLSGTPHYLAPERIRGEQPTPSADIYGLGILFYELLTGKVPWEGNVAQILCGHLELQPTPPSGLIEEGLDPALEKLILRALAKSPATRHKDMAAFIYELRTVMDMLGFSKRHKRRSARRVVIERTENKRDEMARAVFDASRIPLAVLSENGSIQLANAAFAKFVMGVAVDVEGLTVQSTPLAVAWATYQSDLARACAGRPVRRVIELDIAPGETRRLLMWLDPGLGDDQAIFGVHPLDE